jgi:hypothetical protein
VRTRILSIRTFSSLGLAAAALGLLAASGLAARPAGAAPFETRTVTVETEAGRIELVSTIEVVETDPGLWLFRYVLSGDWDPVPGDTNGISSLQILFGGLVDEAQVGQLTAPAGWLVNTSIASPPFGVGFDFPGPAAPGGAEFSFTVPAGTPYTDEDFGSMVGSHEGAVLSDLLFPFVDDAGGFGPLVPVPEPGTLGLVALGVVGLSRRRR